MNCINSKCGREATLAMRFGEVKFYICEYCGRQFSIKDGGQASPEEISRLQRSMQQTYERHVRGFEPVRKTMARIGAPITGKSIRLCSPDDMGWEEPGKVRARTG